MTKSNKELLITHQVHSNITINYILTDSQSTVNILRNQYLLTNISMVNPLKKSSVIKVNKNKDDGNTKIIWVHVLL